MIPVGIHPLLRLDQDRGALVGHEMATEKRETAREAAKKATKAAARDQAPLGLGSPTRPQRAESGQMNGHKGPESGQHEASNRKPKKC